MTTIAAQAADQDSGERGREGTPRAVLRQHRIAVIGLLIVFAAFAIPIIVTGIQAHLAYDQAGAASWIRSKYVGVNILPFVAGMFLGAPIVASDFETGTFRFSMTQGLSIRRQLVLKLLVLGAAVAVAATVLGALSMWALAPSAHLAVRTLSAPGHWRPAYFNITAVMLPAWALLGFSLGTLAGAVIKRAGPAIAVTIVAIGCMAPAMSSYAAKQPGGLYNEMLQVRPVAMRDSTPFGHVTWSSNWPRSVTAKLYRAPGPPGSLWVADWFAGPHRRLTPSQAGVLLNHVPGSVLTSLARSRAWVARRHITAWAGYQPARRYWLFQSVFAAILLAFTGAAGFAAVWLAGRRR
jgi:hypothetical protein